MTSERHILTKVLNFVTGKSLCICRLCLSSSENGVYLEDVIQLKSPFLNKTISFLDMFTNVTNEKLQQELPVTLCAECAGNVINSYLFLQLYEHSKTVWNNSLDVIIKTTDLSYDVNTKDVQTVYLMMKEEDKSILSSKSSLDIKNTTEAVTKLNKLIKRKKSYERNKISQVMCEECGVTLTSRRNFLKHMRRLHSNQKFPCKYCDKTFSLKDNLKYHIERVHLPKKLKCPKCPQMFANEKMLKCHDKTHHRAVICRKCFIEFPSKLALKRHSDKHELTKCPRCDKEYLNKQSLRQHIKICVETDKVPKFFCDLCSKAYMRRQGIRSHLRTAHGFGQAYKCNWCEKKYDSISGLKEHAVKHTRERNFHCEQCGGKFVTRAALMYHQRIHTGEKPFSCVECGEKFLSASRRADHVRRKHFGPTKQCTICSSKFFTKHELGKHMKRHRNPESKLFVAEEILGDNNDLVKKSVS